MKKTKDVLVNNEFIIEQFDEQKTFASFLPGIAGERGIPLWCHYTNRAQAITSFGLRDKNGCILEFYPANTAYRIVDKMGFRTFLKIGKKTYEAFGPTHSPKIKRKMFVSSSMVRLEEENNILKLNTEVTYFILPNENIAGLVRRVKVTNLSEEDISLEILDGLTQLLPTDANEWMLKHQSNLLKSWMDVRVLEGGIPFYYENSVPADTAEVNTSTHGNYCISLVDGKVSPIIYDMNVIFGFDTGLSSPINFTKLSLDELFTKEQVAADKVSGAFCGAKKALKPGANVSIDTVIGYSPNEEFILNKLSTFTKAGYFEQKQQEAKALIDNITSDIETSSNIKLFDAYMKQNYLDNILRGGIPFFIDTKSKHFVYHLFSRRHGDMEREYNFFSIAPEYYSQGNGNFRDVCQNRRSDVLFHPEVGIFNAWMFANLIQLDGYNPLGVLGLKFKLTNDSAVNLTKEILGEENNALTNLLKAEFTPGAIVNLIEQQNLKTSLSDMDIFKLVFENSESLICADFGEGYWVDHWTYLLDLVENTENIYPDKMNEYLFDDYSYAYYDSPVYVLPRCEKYVLNKHGAIRQYGALLEKDQEKISKCHMNEWGSNWLKDESGEVVKTNLYSKLLGLAVTKFSLLDPEGIGISMEANKPGWNDAMNGLPGIFSSGVSEAIELKRLVNYLLDHKDTTKEVLLPTELITLINQITSTYQAKLTKMELFDSVINNVEEFREKTRFGVKNMAKLASSTLQSILELMSKTLDAGLREALKLGGGIYPTFLTYEATSFEPLNKIGHYGLPTVKVNEFKLRPLPLFLEAPARSMKIPHQRSILKKQYDLIKQTALYDTKLKMYKTSVDLDSESFEIGRIRAFQKGWLERESNFLHMTYKYLLGLLKSGLYSEFYKEIKNNFTCFMNPAVYGRSVLENSSFIATSNNPDPAVHGEGFVARLSGSTAEALSMWNIMMFGPHPFILKDGKLSLNLRPILTKEFFKVDGTLTVKFLSKVSVTYDTKLANTFNLSKVIYEVNGENYDNLPSETVQKIRNGKILSIKVHLL